MANASARSLAFRRAATVCGSEPDATGSATILGSDVWVLVYAQGATGETGCR